MFDFVNRVEENKHFRFELFSVTVELFKDFIDNKTVSVLGFFSWNNSNVIGDSFQRNVVSEFLSQHIINVDF